MLWNGLKWHNRGLCVWHKDYYTTSFVFIPAYLWRLNKMSTNKLWTWAHFSYNKDKRDTRLAIEPVKTMTVKLNNNNNNNSNKQNNKKASFRQKYLQHKTRFSVSFVRPTLVKPLLDLVGFVLFSRRCVHKTLRVKQNYHIFTSNVPPNFFPLQNNSVEPKRRNLLLVIRTIK